MNLNRALISVGLPMGGLFLLSLVLDANLSQVSADAPSQASVAFDCSDMDVEYDKGKGVAVVRFPHIAASDGMAFTEDEEVQKAWQDANPTRVVRYIFVDTVPDPRQPGKTYSIHYGCVAPQFDCSDMVVEYDKGKGVAVVRFPHLIHTPRELELVVALSNAVKDAWEKAFPEKISGDIRDADDPSFNCSTCARFIIPYGKEKEPWRYAMPQAQAGQ